MTYRLLRFVLLALLAHATATAAAPRMNLLIITMDDMSCDSVGAYGSKLKGTTPNMDRLASESLRFNHAYVQVGNCMPSRNVMYSGRFPHNNQIEGFYQVRDVKWPHVSDLMKAAGYYTGIRHKVSHSTPYSPYPAWDVVFDTILEGKHATPKNPESYYISAKHGISEARKAGKPFFLNLNVADPHKPFYNEDGRGDPNVPSRIFTADEVPVPGFLFDDPEVRRELAMYYSTVRRGDDSLGQILRALEESGEKERTVTVFLSDHGMPLPFAKTQLYFHSTRTPWMVRWPGVTKPGTVDDRHLISAVDMLPTILDIFGLPHPKGMDGRSFAPVLRGQNQEGRDYIVAEYNENSGGYRHPMRSIITKDYGYLFNPWSNGERVMATATKGTITYRRMQTVAKSNPQVAARLDLFDHRVPEEFYHYKTDPDALKNLIADPTHRGERDRLIKLLDDWMVRTKDPMLEVFRKRNDLKTREAFMAQTQREADDRKAGGNRKPNKKEKGKARKKAAADVE